MLSGWTLSHGWRQVPYLEIINNVTYKHRVAGKADVSAIDRIYDKLDAGLDLVGSVLNRTREPEREITPISTPPIIESRAPKQLGAGFRIIEAIDASTGVETFTVTNGVAKAECSSRALAEKILKAMSEATR